ncbi:MAG: hypothetical protein AAF497_27330 [Planctomycetota bacterium]
MELPLVWRSFFARWPKEMPRKGVVVTNFNEQVGFVNFLMAEHTILLERLAPDSNGGRKVIIPYAKIEAVKVTEPVGNDIFIPCGFRPAEAKAA